MNRLFGIGKPKTTANLTDVAANVDERNETVEKKIGKIDAELRLITAQLSKMRDGPQKNMLKQKALRLLRQKKTYCHQSEQLANQSFNISNTDFALKSLQDTKTTVDAMKVTSKAMKREMKKINIDQVFDVQDDLADMMYEADEIQDALGQNYATPDVDESELEAELMALGGELDSYGLDDAIDVPSVPNTALPGESVPTSATGSKTSVNGVQLDEFGLPQIS
ncbi:Charged multivesicular body protein 5 [Fasciola hepatica]|uniref:Charged multivesicular body protein 5 n=1 Tax=Fasciola hepatica TaxID=6192 RepID=A0A4E0QW77_FASHE|nr:Charged multivesicular body protein 5 [Fasciola hepatica]